MKRGRPETPSENTEIARLEEEIARLKASIRALEDKIADPTLRLMHPVPDYLTKELATLKAQVREIDANVSDLLSQENLNTQIVSALEMSIQQTVDASGHHHIDFQNEIGNYGDQQYYEYLDSREAIATVPNQVPVSDPDLGS